MSLSRREFCLLLLVAATAPQALAYVRADRVNALGLLSSTDSASAIGMRYLAQFPGEATFPALWKKVFGDLSDATDSARLMTYLRQQREFDFCHGRTVVIDGWVLAHTEARVCALVALG